MYLKTFWRILKVCRDKMAAHVTCPCNTKEHQNYLSIFQNFWSIYTKKWSCLQHTNCQNIIKYNLLKNKNSKDKSFKISYCFNYLQLNRLLFQKTRHVLQNKSIKFDKGSLNTGITKYFSIWQTSSPCLHRQSSDCTRSWCSFS